MEKLEAVMHTRTRAGDAVEIEANYQRPAGGEVFSLDASGGATSLLKCLPHANSQNLTGLSRELKGEGKTLGLSDFIHEMPEELII